MFVRWLQKHRNSACCTSFTLKCLNFAQILENFAQSCDFTTSAFRSTIHQEGKLVGTMIWFVIEGHIMKGDLNV